VERKATRDNLWQELAASEAARGLLAEEHAAAQTERDRRDRHVATAADAVIADEAVPIYVRYVQAVETARAAYDDMLAISGMTEQLYGPRWVDRAPLPGLPPLVARAVNLGFGHRDEPPPRGPRAPRSANWAELRHRLLSNADAQI
jgi:hypothetical protein